MRPSILFPLFTDVTQLQGVGTRLRECIGKLCGGRRVIDLLFHLPYDIIDRRQMPAISSAHIDRIYTFVVTIDEHLPSKRGQRTPYKVRCINDTGILHVNFFHGNTRYIKEQLPVGAKRVVSGRIERFNNEIQMLHPDYIVPVEELSLVQKIEPVYALTTGLSARYLQKIMHQALPYTPVLQEWLSPLMIIKEKWPSWHEALMALHTPKGADDLLPTSFARTRLAYDELLANQLALHIARNHATRAKGRAINPNGSLCNKLKSILPFDLTDNQYSVIEEIRTDQCSEHRMLRLLQGDVGSGKTVVALYTMLHAIEHGCQATLMAPTEILARQHMQWIESLCADLGITCKLLISKTKESEKKQIYEAAAAGDIDILIGTHALFQDKLQFKDLACIVIDEQHRFGVEQRLRLSQKGNNADILLMTATPIPRTLTMTAFGDMHVSRLTEKPKNRQPITTSTIPLSRINDVVEGLKRAITQGDQIYWICPLVEESENLDLAAAEERFRELKYVFGDRVGLVHGKMKVDERDATMHRFRDGELALLIATTVVEVGVDVPNATIIVIEHAERFGLAQLHQLRGRVGRGSKPSFCTLLYQDGPLLSRTARARLKMMRDTTDGFVIAEEDLKLRGSGDLMGTKQSGLPSFRLADLEFHRDLLFNANKEAKLILEQDPDLNTERGKQLKTLLYLFEYDTHIRYLREV